jgi:sigma-E factor negative regulatory protein RseB
VVALALVASPVLTGSSQAAPAQVVPGSDPVALALLAGAVQAETAVSFTGVELLSDPDDGTDPTIVDVSHMTGHGTVVVVRGTTTNPTRAGFQDEDVRRPELLVGLLQRTYRLVLDGTGSVAERDARIVAAQRPEGGLAARFWLDEATGLLLRRDVLDRSGRLSSSMRFSQVRLSGESVAYLPPLMPSVRTASLDQVALHKWGAGGWPCPERIGDLTLFDARPVAGASDVLHLTYSDGLSTVSVFVQPGRLDVDAFGPGATAVISGQLVLVRGTSPRELLWSAGGFVLTLVADAPADTIAGAVADLPHTAPPASGWSRVERGLSRVISWVNPFD